MKKILLIFILISSVVCANDQTKLLQEIKILIEQNTKMIEQNGKKIEQNGKKIEQNGKKIEQLDSRLDNVEQRLDFMQNIIYIVLAAVLGAPFYFESKRAREDKNYYKTDEKIKAIITALRELSQDDPKVKRSLDIVGL